VNKIKNKLCIILFLFTLISVFITGCGNTETTQNLLEITTASENTAFTQEISTEETTSIIIEESTSKETTPQSEFEFSNIPKYSDKPYVAVNNNIPFFDVSNLTAESFEKYAPLDSLSRCGVAYACIGKDIMPTEKSGSIGSVKPSGWQTVKYDNVDGKYLYNRCHLIGYQLAGENANEKNLITGTRYLNIDGMLPFENMTADYVKETNNHVLYRVTPIFESDNLLASGVLMEGYSVEDKGAGICFCAYAYNVQPDIEIDYSNGNSKLVPSGKNPSKEETKTLTQSSDASSAEISQSSTYILNTNSNKFHYPFCSAVTQISEKNKQEYSGTRDKVVEQGFVPCKRCSP